MSKLEELINEYCPNGVEYLTIAECTLKISSMKWKQESSSNFYHYIDLTSVDRASHRIIETSLINKENAPSRAQQIVKAGDILFGGTRPMLKRYCLVPNEYDGQVCSTGFCVIRPDNKKILVNWLYHNISSSRFFSHVELYQKGASYPAITDKEVRMFSIPVPPLPVQEEIVRILDNFTNLTAELQAKLQEEFNARKKQYEYYSSLLISKSTDNVIPMSELAKFVYGYTDKASEEGDTRFIRITDINEQGGLYKENAKYIFLNEEARKSLLKKGDLVMARTGATYGKTLYFESDEPSVYASFLIKIIPDYAKLDARYYWHFTKTALYWKQANNLVTTGGQPQFNTPALKQIKVPVPPIEEQRRIVKILDKLNALCNDLSTGLPAEIATRQKQYEYYRDKLLTFKKAE